MATALVGGAPILPVRPGELSGPSRGVTLAFWRFLFAFGRTAAPCRGGMGRGPPPGRDLDCEGGELRLANVGRALFMAVWIDALNVWESGIHARGLVIGGVGTFVLGLLMFEGFEWRDRRRETSMPGPPPSLPRLAQDPVRAAALVATARRRMADRRRARSQSVGFVGRPLRWRTLWSMVVVGPGWSGMWPWGRSARGERCIASRSTFNENRSAFEATAHATTADQRVLRRYAGHRRNSLTC